MKKILLTAFVLLVLFPLGVYAGSDLQISANSDFSNLKTDFSPGETVYVKVTANSEGKTKKELNLRDNTYGLISTHSLDYLGNNTFRGSLSAPSNSGYYSLETRIESDGSVSNSVKTIRVGSSSGDANVKVKIENSTGKVLSNNIISPNQNQKMPTPTPTVSPSDSPTPTPEPSAEPAVEPQQNSQNLFAKIFGYFKKLFESIF